MVAGPPNVPEMPKDRRRREFIERLVEQQRQKIQTEQEQRKGRREAINLIIALLALIASLYSLFVTHRDAEETLHQTQRSYVGVEINTDYKSTTPHATVHLKVIGVTPVQNVTGYGNEVTLKEGDSIDNAITEISRKPKDKFIEGALLMPGASLLLDDSPTDSKRGYFDPSSGTRNVLLGIITYTDHFNVVHHTKFCIEHANFCKTGNETD